MLSIGVLAAVAGAPLTVRVSFASAAVTRADAAQKEPPSGCGGQQYGTTGLGGLVQEAHPVVLVHGWTDGPMQSMREALESYAKQGWQYLLFNYEPFNTRWANDKQVAGCLAEYLLRVSDRHRDRGGDGRVYLVAHSMGGLAIRFALGSPFGLAHLKNDRIGGVITVGTPHRGSGLGDTMTAMVKSRLAGEDDHGFPPEGALAWECLAAHMDEKSCSRPPYIDWRLDIAQVAGEVTFRRNLFGLKAYDVPLFGDGIVPSRSAHGYRGSDRPVGVRQPADAGEYADGGPFSLVSAPCLVSGTDLTDALPKHPIPMLAALFAKLKLDEYAIDAFDDDLARDFSDVELAALAEFWLGVQLTASCSHRRSPTDPTVVAAVAARLRAMANSHVPVTSLSLIRPLAVPDACAHGADTITGGIENYGEFGQTYLGLGSANAVQRGQLEMPDPVLADVTGDGADDAVLALLCNSGGSAEAGAVLLYTGAGPRLAGHVFAPGEQALRTQVSTLRVDGEVVRAQDVHGPDKGQDKMPMVVFESRADLGLGVVKEWQSTAQWSRRVLKLTGSTEVVAPGCGDQLTAAVNAQWPLFDVAVFRCDGSWAWTGDASGMGDTEMLWRRDAAADGGWEYYTGFPSALCPNEVLSAGAPAWVADIFDYREPQC